MQPPMLRLVSVPDPDTASDKSVIDNFLQTGGGLAFRIKFVASDFIYLVTFKLWFVYV